VTLDLHWEMLTGVLVGVASCFPGVSAKAFGAPSPLARHLSDYRTDDGAVPDGTNPELDATTALVKALGAGPGIVYVGPGAYRWSAVSIPAGVSVVGAGPATAVHAAGGQPIFTQSGVHGWSVRDLALDGGADPSGWRARTDEGRHGMVVSGCWGYEITGVTLRNFAGAGLQIDRNGAGWKNGGRLERITASGNYAGVRFDVRAEYMSALTLVCFNNVIGCILHAGNVILSASAFTENIDGMLIEDKDNGSHGSIVNCLFNHNERYALAGRNVANGMAIGDCCFFYGTIDLENCVGVSLTGGIIGSAVRIAGAGVNRLADNYVIPEGKTFEFSPSTIVDGNYTAAGPAWVKP